VKQLNATVISTKMKQSAVVVVETSWMHPLYKKIVKRAKKYLVENTQNAVAGDHVVIQETRPLSARKRFTITTVLNKKDN
jgi:small subunit ribosomal protein S17